LGLYLKLNLSIYLYVQIISYMVITVRRSTMNNSCMCIAI
jgi:hypothetical protein